MEFFEPGSKQFRKIFAAVAILFSVCFVNLAGANESTPGEIFNISTGWRNATDADLGLLVKQAQAVVTQQFSRTEGAVGVQLVPEAVVGNPRYASVRFRQMYNDIEVYGMRAAVHYLGGQVVDVTKRPLRMAVATQAKVTPRQAYEILNDQFQAKLRITTPKLKIYRDVDGTMHLAYHIKTRTMPGHIGREVFLDAIDGRILQITKRIYDLGEDAKITIWSAATKEAQAHVDDQGYPEDINLDWYEKLVDNGTRTKSDESGERAFNNSAYVHEYFKKNFNRSSYDDKGSPLVSVVHMGLKMNNAFWTDEFKIMGYGDGDGERLLDLTLGADVAAHELTHAVTSSTANLMYAAESGALNEAYSDFFGKMVDWGSGNWYIGEKIIGPVWKAKRKALRNMMNPEEFKQPGSNDSPLRVSTKGSCNSRNDYCGVHTNSGIPNRASALIVEAIGKEKTEQLYYKVLTSRLSANSTFRDARVETEKECARMFGAQAQECAAVTQAFDTVKM